MGEKDYITIRVTKDIGDLIDDILSIKKFGFSSRADVVRVALREYYENKKKDGLIKD